MLSSSACSWKPWHKSRLPGGWKVRQSWFIAVVVLVEVVPLPPSTLSTTCSSKLRRKVGRRWRSTWRRGTRCPWCLWWRCWGRPGTPGWWRACTSTNLLMPHCSGFLKTCLNTIKSERGCLWLNLSKNSIVTVICILKWFLVLMYESLYNEKVLLVKMLNILDIYSHGRT